MASKQGGILHYKIEKIQAAGFIGQCVEIPALIVQAKTESELGKKMDIATKGYFEACPEAYKMLTKPIGMGQVEIGKKP